VHSITQYEDTSTL